MKSYIKRIISVVLSLTIAVGATSFTKFSNVNAQETPLALQEPSVLNEENTDLEINDLAGLVAFRDIVNSSTKYKGKTVVLNADIDMSGIDNWDAIGTFTSFDDKKPFKGTFKGNNHKISNLKINKEKEAHQGLFGEIEGATIENLGVENANVKGRLFVGGLVGYNDNGTIKNSYATGEVKGEDSAGGLAGFNNSGKIENSYGAVDVTTGIYVGGLVGNTYEGIIENSYATGSVAGEYFVGGLVGSNKKGTVKNSYAIGEIKGKDKVGGLIGDNDSGAVTNSYYDKDRTGQSDTGKGTPLKTIEMTGDNAKTNMKGFDFSSVWGAKTGIGLKLYYPYLRNFGDISVPFIELK